MPEQVIEPNLEILMRHRAVLFGLIGAFMVFAAFKPGIGPRHSSAVSSAWWHSSAWPGRWVVTKSGLRGCSWSMLSRLVCSWSGLLLMFFTRGKRERCNSLALARLRGLATASSRCHAHRLRMALTAC